jgi:uncharacterized membrane protein
MKKNVRSAFVIALVVIPCIYLAIVYNTLPARVATHFSIDGKPDAYKDKSALPGIVVFLTLLNLGMYLLLSNLYKIDPKKAAKLSKDTMQKIGLGIVLLLTIITVLIIYSAMNNGFKIDKIIFPLVGLFFAYMGNMMHSVKPNYFVGIRTPWALEDEETWRKTHQLAGKLWFIGGLIIAIGALVLNHKSTFYLLVAITLVITLIPAIFSYRYYQSHKNISKT